MTEIRDMKRYGQAAAGGPRSRSAPTGTGVAGRGGPTDGMPLNGGGVGEVPYTVSGCRVTCSM
jgi:hypothetical protein